MRKVVTDHLLSLDGYFGGPNGEIDWFGFDEESMEWSRADRCVRPGPLSWDAAPTS